MENFRKNKMLILAFVMFLYSPFGYALEKRIINDNCSKDFTLELNDLSIIDMDDSTVKSLDIKKYMGVWYEIARYQNSFEKGMTNVSAKYTLMKDGKISVVNSGIKKGKMKSIVGKAKQPNPAEPGKLKVSFFLWFYGDYNIIYLDKDYKYAIVTGYKNMYLWILSREKVMLKSKLEELLDILVYRGYDISNLIYVNQN